MKRRLAIAAVLLCTLFAASVAYAATITFYPGRGGRRSATGGVRFLGGQRSQEGPPL